MNIRFSINGEMNKVDNLEGFDQEKWVGGYIYAKVKELFFGFRLLYILIILLIITVISLYFIIKNISTSLPIKSIIYGVLVVGPILGILTKWELSRNIVGRFYYLSPLSPKRGVYLIIIGILTSWILLFIQMILKEWYNRYIFIPVVFGFPISLLIDIIWLINYEKVHGKVYVKWAKTSQ